MKEFETNSITAKKRVSQHTLAQYNALEMLNHMRYMDITIFPAKFNESLVREFYANLTADIDNANSPIYEQLYVRGTVIVFTPTNIITYLSCTHYPDIGGTGLEEEFDL